MARRHFDGKTVLVTGAARGLGKALCVRFGGEDGSGGEGGARIAALDVDAPALEATAGELRAAGITIETAICDLRDEQATFDAACGLEERLGPIDVLIANAGVTHIEPFAPKETAAVRRLMEVNFLGAVHATAAVFDSIVARRGLIVAISSVAGYAPLVGRTAYCASKHALHGFFDTLRAELRGKGVQVLLVCPSSIATGLRDRYRATGEADPTVGGEDTPEAVADRIYRAARANRRMISVGRVGHLARWLHRFAPRLYERLMLRGTR